MSDFRLVRIATFDDPNLANIAKANLQANGVRAVLQDEHHIGMDWMLTTALGGIKLCVRECDQKTAQKILDTKPDVLWLDEFDDESDGIQFGPACPSCGSRDTYEERLNRKRIFLSLLLLGIPLPFWSNKTVCDRCDHRWCAA